MRTHIDWLTFTMTMQYGAVTQGAGDFAEEYALAIEQAFLTTFGAMLVADTFGGKWEKNERSRAPYVDSWTMEGRGVSLFASPTLTHCCVEISGVGCERLITTEKLGRVLAAVSERITRIDIATDIETGTRPSEFVGQLNHARMTARGFQKSKTGETCYVGSQKSDRYARVYRYEPPHPRAKLLRVECVFRREQAKIAAKYCVDKGVDAAAAACTAVFGFTHRDWAPLDSGFLFESTVKGDRAQGKTVFWLATSAASAFKRLVASGEIIDGQAFLDRHFLSN